MKKLIELHRVGRQIAPENKSFIENEISVNPEYISLIEPCGAMMPNDMSDVNPNAIGDKLTQITLVTSDDERKSKKIVVAESYDYILSLIKNCDNEFISFTSGTYPCKQISILKNSIIRVEDRAFRLLKGDEILKTFVTVAINGGHVEEYQVNETVEEIKAMLL